MDNRNALWHVKDIILLAIGFASEISIQFGNYSYVYGVSTLVLFAVFLYLVTTSASRRKLGVIGVFFTAGYIIRFFGVTGIAAVDVVLVGIAAVFVYALMLVYRLVIVRFDFVLVTLVFPILWICGHTLASLIRVPSVMRVDMMFFDMKHIIQSESLIYSHGLEFLIVWICALAAYAFCTGKYMSLGIAGITVVLLAGFGFAKLGDEVNKEYVKVAYSTGPYVGDYMNYEVLDYDTIEQSFDKAVERAVELDADIITFNEETYEIKDSDEARFIEHAKAEAAKDNIHVLVGLDVDDTDNSEGGRNFNKIIWIDNIGNELGQYEKYETIPVMESDYIRGDGVIPEYLIDVSGRQVKVAFAICYDSNFPEYVRQIDPDTDILFLPSWDWKGITDLHYRICGNISVENNVAMIKPTYDGYSVATDSFGRILTLTNTDDTGYENVQVVDIPVKGDK